MEIRKFVADDRESYYRMSGEFYNTDAALHQCPIEIRESVFNDIMSGSPFIEGYMLMQDGEEAGFALLANSYGTEFGKRVVWVEELFIDDKFRNRGLGSQFLKWLEDECEKRNAVTRLEVSPENERVFELYLRSGFEDLGYLQMVKTEKN